jgi:hypothetical protein
MENINQINKRIAFAFKKLGLDQRVSNDIAFHMTDWKENLEQLVKLYQHSELLNDEQIRKIIITFLAHVPNHVAAAKKLVGLGPIEDIFKVGVTEEDADIAMVRDNQSLS